MAKSLYPLLLRPLPRADRPSSNLLPAFLNDPSNLSQPSPSDLWQAVDCGDLQSVVTNGILAGTTLRTLVEEHPEDLVGRRHAPDTPFPLVTRILDVGTDQPWQVHPDHRLDIGGQTFQPNAKLWFSLAATRGSTIVAGIAPRVTGQQLLSQMNKPGMNRLLRRMPARAGDAYLITPGMLHSASSGNLLYEVGFAPWPPLRLGSADNEETVSEAELTGSLQALHLEARQNPRVSREASPMTHTRRICLTPNCPYFQVDEIRLFDPISMRMNGDSFHLLTTIKGCVRLRSEGTDTELQPGVTCCVPAGNADYQLHAETDDTELLRVTRAYVP